MPKEPLFNSIDPYIVALIPLVDWNYPPVVPFNGLLGDNHYRESPTGMPRILALLWGRIVRRLDVTTVEKNLICGPRIPDSS